MSGYLGTLVPKVHWGLKIMWKKLQKFPKKIDDFPRNFVSLLFQICFLRPKRFPILPLDGGVQHLIHKKFFDFIIDNSFCLVCLSKKKTGKPILICFRFNEYPERDLSKNDFTSEGLFFSFVIQKSEKSQF